MEKPSTSGLQISASTPAPASSTKRTPSPRPSSTSAETPPKPSADPNADRLIQVLMILQPLHDIDSKEHDEAALARILSAACAYFEVEPKGPRLQVKDEDEGWGGQ
jgi:hypothetical protein